MASSFEKFQKRRLISSYFSVVLSIFLVLFLLGALGFFVIHSEKISNSFKEDIPMSVYFKDEANDSILKAFDAKLKASKYVKDYIFVSKDDAAKNNKGHRWGRFSGILRHEPATEFVRHPLQRGIRGICKNQTD